MSSTKGQPRPGDGGGAFGAEAAGELLRQCLVDEAEAVDLAAMVTQLFAQGVDSGAFGSREALHRLVPPGAPSRSRPVARSHATNRDT
jgi:hypothetical protein